MKTVRKIQAFQAPKSSKLRVAAYARVSDSRLHQSLSTQVSYYSRLIQANPEWDLVGIYYDEGVSGKQQQNRHGFTDLLQDCKEGKIDKILTKSIARFGRNTVELLQTVRELKEKRIGVLFEKEGIDSLSSDGELLLTLLASVAQEESYNLSENSKWNIKKRFEQGLPHTPQDMYGYRWDGEQYVVEETEAHIIRQIFSWYLEGWSVPAITKELNQLGVRTRKGNPFTVSSVREFFKQEAYIGRLVLQKTFREDFSRTPKRNKGQRTKYVVEDAHEPIVSKGIFDLVLAEKQRRFHLSHQESHLHKGVFREKITCSVCGKKMITKVDSKKVNQTIRYYCRTRNRYGSDSCPTKTLGEKRLLEVFEESLGVRIDKDWVACHIMDLVFDSRLQRVTVTPNHGKTCILNLRKE